MIFNDFEVGGKDLIDQGGFRERMYKSRSTVREENTEPDINAPKCSECGKPMRKRSAQHGKYSGSEFWGCSAYPECKGILNISDSDVTK